jgi:membrane protein
MSDAIVATIRWLPGSVGFTVYVTHLNNYDKTYGSLGGAVAKLTWLDLSQV